MAFYIEINKESEDARAAQYRFEADRQGVGRFEIDKATGQVELLSPMPGDEKEKVFQRAAVKIIREWREGRLPERAEWAS
ncbi:MAG: hypothetical protein JOZ54_08900 [Acidobacteria bacterium]|nr:hypothetical protein [Acidobacteriota bacterium]